MIYRNSDTSDKSVLLALLIIHNFRSFLREAATGFEPMIAILQTAALPLGYAAVDKAGNGIRTRDINLGKVALYH